MSDTEIFWEVTSDFGTKLTMFSAVNKFDEIIEEHKKNPKSKERINRPQTARPGDIRNIRSNCPVKRMEGIVTLQ